ncbi:hypothetical protein TWF694_001400 [Orbilia ellipsospora]|uniref:Pre-mRNA polyadenylation factor Fip1 domain-containing protein n=1 Tax=Orbilia ellipsospora TaxID=2528407 RepID=A0AAV9XRW4_9PEZI
MDEDDDDFYGDASPPPQPQQQQHTHQVAVQDLLSRDNSTPKPTLAAIGAQAAQLASGTRQDVNMNDDGNDAEGGEEEDEEEEIEVEVEEDDDDVEFIFEPKAGQAVAPPPQGARYAIRPTAPTSVAPQRQASHQELKEHTINTAVAASSSASPAPRSAALASTKTPVPRGPTPPPIATSTLDINAVPTHPSTGDKLTSLNIDDLPSKPWRNPGSDVSDYFNYGFDEFTWTAYCQKQDNTRKDFDPKKMMEDMMMFGNMLDPSAIMNMPGGGAGGATGGGANAGNMGNQGAGGFPSGMPLPPGIPPEMAAMMQQVGMPGMPGMPGMQGMPGFGMDMMGGGNNTPNRQDMQMFNAGNQGGFGPQGMNQFQAQMGNSYAEEQQRFEQQKYMQQQQRLQQQQRVFNNPNAAYGNFQAQNPGNQMGRGRGGPGVQGGAGNVSQQRGW